MNVLSKPIHAEEKGGKIFLTEDNWELWQKDFRAYVMNCPECQQWLDDEVKPAYRIQLRVQQVDENGFGVMEGDPPERCLLITQGMLELEDHFAWRMTKKQTPRSPTNWKKMPVRLLDDVSEHGYELTRRNRDILCFFELREDRQ